jgi:TPR repeat protein
MSTPNEHDPRPPRSVPDSSLAPAEEAETLFHAALCALHGLGEPRNEAEGLMRLELAAVAGCADAQHLLGTLHFTGRWGAQKSDTSALRWIEQAGAQGCAASVTVLDAAARARIPGSRGAHARVCRPHKKHQHSRRGTGAVRHRAPRAARTGTSHETLDTAARLTQSEALARAVELANDRSAPLPL